MRILLESAAAQRFWVFQQALVSRLTCLMSVSAGMTTVRKGHWFLSCHLNVYKLSSGTTMESASLKNRLKTFLLLAKTIHALNDLADESDFFVEWAVDGSLDMDDMARSFAILGAEDMPYIYYSLYSEREAHDTGSLTLYYGCERPDSDDSELAELGNIIKIGFAGECLNVSWDGSPYSGIEVSHSKASLRDLHEDACMMVCLYLHNSTVDKYPAVYERHCPNECLEAIA